MVVVPTVDKCANRPLPECVLLSLGYRGLTSALQPLLGRRAECGVGAHGVV
jgi:hypothetical protein